VVDRAYGFPLEREERASAPLAGGIIRNGYQCGIIWGSTLAAGAEAHRRFGAGTRAEGLAIAAAQRIVSSFRARNGAIDCFDLTDTDFGSSAQTWKYLLGGKPVGCFRMAARYAPVAKTEIDAALAASGVVVAEQRASCSALLARRMGASEAHQVMVAGFAGGVGLCGGACGALGAAVWLGAMNRDEDFKAAEARAGGIVERFLAASGHRFECTDIVGRKFESAADHAAYLRQGGCGELIDAVARAGSGR
jgi:hypothetical protein